MKTLVKWQVISFISRGIAMALGIIQSFVIIRILSVSEWGVVQIAMSVGGAFGIYQHLGLSSGLTREISAAKKDTDVFKRFLTGVFIRYCVTVPISIFLFVAAPNIAIAKYSEPALVLPIRIYSLVLLLQSVQSLFDAVISGTKRFKQLFIYQAVIAVVSVLLYIPLVYLYKINGYFYALAGFNLVASIVMGILALAPLKGKLLLPTKSDFKLLLKELLSISLAIYAVKIIYTWWEKLGPILLGLSLSKEMVGYFAFALLYGKKIMMVSDSVTAVNLPVLSEKYVNDFKEFKRLFTENFDRIFAFIIFAAISAIYWSQEIITLVAGKGKYDNSFPLIFPVVFAFVLYAFVNIVKSSIVVPAKMIREMITSFCVLIAVTIGFYFGAHKFINPVFSMAYAMAAGAFAGLLFLVLVSQKKLKFSYFTHEHVLILIQGVVIALSGAVPVFAVKLIQYVLFVGLFVWANFIARFVDKADVRFAAFRIQTFWKKLCPRCKA